MKNAIANILKEYTKKNHISASAEEELAAHPTEEGGED